LLGQASGKVSPVRVAAWLEDFAHEAQDALGRSGPPGAIEAARLGVDIEIQIELGRFFAAKFRAGVLMALFEQSRDRRALDAAVAQYGAARGHWARLVALADGVYGDVSSSDILSEHGAWADKLAAIDADIAALQALAQSARPGDDPRLAQAITAVLASPIEVAPPMAHEPPATFRPGQDLALAFTATAQLTAARLWCRPVNQALRWRSVEMVQDSAAWRVAAPADAVGDGAYPLQYYAQGFEASGRAFLYPGLTARPRELPYFVLRRADA
jgi:hypothetical protein